MEVEDDGMRSVVKCYYTNGEPAGTYIFRSVNCLPDDPNVVAHNVTLEVARLYRDMMK